MIRALALAALLALVVPAADGRPRKRHHHRVWVAKRAPARLFPSLAIVVPHAATDQAAQEPPPSGPPPPVQGEDPPPPAPVVYPSRTAIDEDEYWVYAAHGTLAAGPVELNARNFGMDDHDLTIADGQGAIVAQVYLTPGETVQLTPTLAAGTYRLYCSLYDGAHDQLGMNAQLVVK